MAYVYRYIDNTDNIVKYIGIVTSKSRSLRQRHKEHLIQDKWCTKNLRLEYIIVDNKGIAESIEGHLIALYGTDKYYNISKADWGINPYLPTEYEWINFTTDINNNIYLYQYSPMSINSSYVSRYPYVSRFQLERCDDGLYMYKDKRKKVRISDIDILNNKYQTLKLNELQHIITTHRDKCLNDINKKISLLNEQRNSLLSWDINNLFPEEMRDH